jgi:hypothetical protein
MKANLRLADDFYTKQKRKVTNTIKNLYIGRDINFRGFR